MPRELVLTCSTSNVTGRHRGPRRKLRAGVACAAHLCKFCQFFRHLGVTGYKFPFHVHILCVLYGTVLTNTAVLCMRVRSVCLPVHGDPGECYYNTAYYAAMRFHRRVWYSALSLRYACIRRSGIILIP